MNTVTNKDAKIIYSKYWYKSIGEEQFPIIYIDEYWDYAIDLFNLRESWETFLKGFNEEFKSAEQYIEESNKILSNLKNEYLVQNIKEKLKGIELKTYDISKIDIHDIPDDEYLVIDLSKAFTQCLIHLGCIRQNKTYDDIICQSTNSKLLRESKILRLQLYQYINSFITLYNICGELLCNVLKNKKIKKKINQDDIIGIRADSLYIKKDVNLNLGDYNIDGIDVHIKKVKINSIKYKDEIIKYMDTDTIGYFWKPTSKLVPIDEFCCVQKTIKNQQLNQIDLTVGYEEQIFYIMD